MMCEEVTGGGGRYQENIKKHVAISLRFSHNINYIVGILPIFFMDLTKLLIIFSNNLYKVSASKVMQMNEF